MKEHICAKPDCPRVVSEEAKDLNIKFNNPVPENMICLGCIKIALKKKRGQKMMADEMASKQKAKEFAERNGSPGKRTKLPKGYTTRGRVAGVLGLHNPTFKKHFLETGVFETTEFKDNGSCPVQGIAVKKVLELVDKLEWSPEDIEGLLEDLARDLADDIEMIRMRIENGALDR